jgi:hypothetical protein
MVRRGGFMLVIRVSRRSVLDGFDAGVAQLVGERGVDGSRALKRPHSLHLNIVLPTGLAASPRVWCKDP